MRKSISFFQGSTLKKKKKIADYDTLERTKMLGVKVWEVVVRYPCYWSLKEWSSSKAVSAEGKGMEESVGG